MMSKEELNLVVEEMTKLSERLAGLTCKLAEIINKPEGGPGCDSFNGIWWCTIHNRHECLEEH